MSPGALCLVSFLAIAGTALPAGAQAPPPPRTPTPPAAANPPDWLQVGVDYRGRFEGPSNAGFTDGRDDAYWLNRFRVDAHARASGWLSFQAQAQDAQVFGRNNKPDGPPYEDTFDLRMAFADVGPTSGNPLTARLGRQELLFGEQRLVGVSNWSNTARSFDAARVEVIRKGVKVDGFAASVVTVRDGEFNRSLQGENFYGAYTSFSAAVPKTVLEPYLFLKTVREAKAESGESGHLRGVTLGTRLTWKASASLDVNTEMVMQRGSLASDAVSAWAGHWQLVYALHTKRVTHLTGEYNYASGDRDPKDGTRGTFDQLYATAHEKYGLADQIAWRNIHHARAVFDMKPNPKWMLTMAYHSWWLASLADNLYAAGGAVLVRPPAGGHVGSHVGQEIDVQTTYAVTPRVQIAGGYGHIIPGEFLSATTPGAAYSFPYVMITSTILKAGR